MDSSTTKSSSRSPWTWIPSLYFAEGLPYVIVMTVSVIMYKKLGVSNTEIALYTSWLYLPWVIKPFWSPLVDVLRTKRWWIVVMQLLIGAGLAGVAFAIPVDGFLQYTLAFLWLMAFSSATHDIAADGFYMLPLSSHEQAWFVGIRSTFYRLAMIAGQGLLVMLAGTLEEAYGLPEQLVTVQAVADGANPATFDPESFTPNSSDQEQSILFSEQTYQVGIGPTDREQIDGLVEQVRDWNVEHGFYESETLVSQEATEKSAWLRSLESWIADRFGPGEEEAPASTSSSGQVAIVLMRLNRPLAADESRAVNFSFRKGDANFQVVEGTRFVLNQSNSKLSFASVVQLDYRLDRPSMAVFRALSGDTPLAWQMTFVVAAGFFVVVCLYHCVALPRPAEDVAGKGNTESGTLKEFLLPFGTFFRKPGVVTAVVFLMLYRFSEAQLVKLSSPFLLDDTGVGGLALSTGQVGFAYGTVGIIMLTLGGILGGIVAARHGLKHWLWWMVVAMNLPNAVYVFLSQWQPDDYLLVNLAVGIEQFGYGFGFTAYMLYMLYVSRGEHETAHFAICTGFMALGMMLPGMFSGWLQELIGYQHFFLWVMLATLPSFLVCFLVDIDPSFGREVPDTAFAQEQE